MRFDQKRRELITLLTGAAMGSLMLWPLAARAQQAASIPKIGVLWPGASPPASPRMESFQQALCQAGYVEGQTVVIELRYAQGGLQQLPDLAAELEHFSITLTNPRRHGRARPGMTAHSLLNHFENCASPLEGLCHHRLSLDD